MIVRVDYCLDHIPIPPNTDTRKLPEELDSSDLPVHPVLISHVATQTARTNEDANLLTLCEVPPFLRYFDLLAVSESNPHRSRSGARDHAIQQIAPSYEVCDELGLRLKVYLAGIPNLLKAPVLHDRHSIRNGNCLFLIVGNMQRRNPQLPLQAPNLTPKLFSQERIKRAHRLIEQEDVGPRGNRSRNSDSLLLSRRQFVWGALAVA